MLTLIKKIFRQTGLLPLFYHKLNKILPSYESLNPANLKVLKKAFKEAPNGDYYEFGVYKGFSFWFAMQIVDILNIKNTHFYGFDSFDGLPIPKGIDKEKILNGTSFARGNFTASKNFVNNFLIKYGAKKENYDLIEGFYDESLNKNLLKKYKFKKASIILVDCDLYESTKTVLTFATKLIQNNTIIVFDDWGITNKNKGEKLAFKEWSESNPKLSFEDFFSYKDVKSFKIKLKS